MFEQAAPWNEYYRELEPQKRRALLDRMCADEPDDGANAYRRALFQARHTDPKKPGRQMDFLLFMCLDFMKLYSSALIFRRGTVRDVRRYFAQMRFDEADALGEAGRRALYWEIRNAAARYLSTCSGAGYNRSVFGLVPSKDEGRQARILRDMYQMSEGLSRRTGLDEEMALWNQAILDAYAMTDENAKARFAAYAASK